MILSVTHLDTWPGSLPTLGLSFPSAQWEQERSLTLAKISHSKVGFHIPKYWSHSFSEATELESKLEFEECFAQQVEADRNQAHPGA